MLLVIDIGNSHIVFGVFHENKLIQKFRTQARHQASSDEYACFILQMLASKNVKQVVIASVVPSLNQTFERLCCDYFEGQFVWIKHDMIRMDLKVDQPAQVGIDRIINAYAAFQKNRQALVVVDMGTATKFDVVNSQGEFLGGVISSGLEMMCGAFFDRITHVPRVPLLVPKQVIGKNTQEALQSGLVLGYVVLVDSLVQQIKQELGINVKVLATGGVSSLIKPHSSTIEELDLDLTLTGIYLIYREWERV